MSERERPWWNRPGVLVALILLTTLPLLWPTIPPLVDLPGHMSRYAVAADGGRSGALGGYYGFHWRLIGNLGVDLLVVPLAQLIGVEGATKLVVGLIPPLTALGFILTSRAVQDRVPPTALFALPLAYGYPFQFGFVNYALSMALAFLAFAGWLTLADRGRFALRAVLFVPVGFVVWLAHTYGWGVLGLLAFSAEFYRLWRGGKPLWRALAEAPVQCLPLAPPAILMVLWRAGDSAGRTGKYFEWTNKGRWIINALRDRWEAFDVASVVVLLLVLALVLPLAAWGRSVRFGPRLTFGALAMLAAFVLMPRIVFGSNYADMRMVPFVLAALLLSIRVENRRWAGWIAAVGAVFLVVRIGATTVSYALYDRQSDRQLQAVEHIRPNSRIVALVGNDCRDLARPDRVYHLPSLAVVRRHAFVNDQFLLPGAKLLSVRYHGAAPFVSDPSQIVTPIRCGAWRTVDRALAVLPWGGFDHLWLMDIEPEKWPTDPRLALVWRSGDSVLYDVRGSALSPVAAQPRRATASRDTPNGRGKRPTR